MKQKLVIVAVILLLVTTGCLYLFIPSVIRISHAQNIPVPTKAGMRCFSDPAKIEKWWPGKIMNGKDAVYNGYQFTFSPFNIVGIQKTIIADGTANGFSLTSAVSANILGPDSSFLYWTCDVKTSLSPIARFKQYLAAKKIKKTIAGILTAFSAYTGDLKNVYDFPIERRMVTDTLFISEKKELSFYPGVTEIYGIINSLRSYMAQEQVSPANSPICNINPKDDGGFSLIAAIPIHKRIKETKVQKIKTMLYNGNQLVTEVKGGDYTVNRALDAQRNFIEDYQLTPAVLPYLSLVTDRQKIPDSSKWITRVCSPVY